MNRILGNWSTMRAFRLAIGIIIIIQGARSHNVAWAVLGGLFALMAIANWGCCGSSGCGAPRHSRRDHSDGAETIYEEVK